MHEEELQNKNVAFCPRPAGCDYTTCNLHMSTTISTSNSCSSHFPNTFNCENVNITKKFTLCILRVHACWRMDEATKTIQSHFSCNETRHGYTHGVPRVPQVAGVQTSLHRVNSTTTHLLVFVNLCTVTFCPWRSRQQNSDTDIKQIVVRHVI